MKNNNPQLSTPAPTLRQRMSMATAKFRRKIGLPTLNHTVHFILLSPSDGHMTTDASFAAIAKSAAHLKSWYQTRMGNGKTFNFDVRMYYTDHESRWYTDNDPSHNHAGAYWNNVLYDAARYAGAGFYQPYDDWVIYIDVNPLPDQYAGGTSGGYTSGCAVMGAKDIASLRGIDPDWTQCRGIGGSGHEFGHTLGLPHPPAGPDFERAIMGTGYMIYPQCVLLQDNINQLNANPFMIEQPTVTPPAGLCPLA